MSKRSNNKTSVCTILNCAAVLLVFLFASGLNNPATSTAAEPPSEPILRINTEMHTAAIIRIGVDAESKYLVTGSEDKTVKVWDISSGRLLQTLRVPIGDGDEGKVAISPDGRTIVCGGWTGAEWDNKTASIYIFDRQTGKLI
ncbi:MAG: hypothetical protein HQK94_16050, partial [Nitrospirae bacterium]|nr:hypothetical protein [Nitrospirota bacterium]